MLRVSTSTVPRCSIASLKLFAGNAGMGGMLPNVGGPFWFTFFIGT